MPRYIKCPSCQKACPFDNAGSSKYATCPGCGRSVFLSADLAEALAELSEVGDDPPRERERTPRRSRATDSERDRTPPSKREDHDELPPGTATTYKDVPSTYLHPHCGGRTTISEDVVRKIAADPWGLVTSTLCARCGQFVSLAEVEWVETQESVSSFRSRLRREMPIWLTSLRLALGPIIGTLLGIVIGVICSLNRPLDGLSFGLILGLLVGATLGYFVVGWIWQAVAAPRIPLEERED